jgi:predicted transcriptional regulator
MAQIEVPEKYAAELQALAQQDDRSLQSVVDEALGIYISERYIEHQLSPADIEHIRLGIAAADRGELVPSEEIEAFFDDWEREATAK